MPKGNFWACLTVSVMVKPCADEAAMNLRMVPVNDSSFPERVLVKERRGNLNGAQRNPSRLFKIQMRSKWRGSSSGEGNHFL